MTSVHGVSPSLVCGVSPLPLESHSVVVADMPKLGVAKMSDGHREVAPAVPVQFPSAETLDYAKTSSLGPNSCMSWTLGTKR